MCTQELLWCSCGHGEFLPPQRCYTALSTGVCWTVVHGNSEVVMPFACAYCAAGLNEARCLGPVWPVPGPVVGGKGDGVGEGEGEGEGGCGGLGPEGMEREGAVEPLDWNELLKTDFDVSQDLWECS
ncbi:hypothetical protein EJ03DRAFT_348400 [Teratosphaeria nubilosa]|uniref:Uncharacterized protein n=1 Tax=Teratosphaeria nubilosa TaxID=161662 RepID=A0A6G1LJ37_9PEZI|nr:hypothetical protein EJ03DRAFT_348400 [Teratosphaeria nubilosa]